MLEIPKFFETVLWYVFDNMDIEEHIIDNKNYKFFYDRDDSLFAVLIENKQNPKLLKEIWKLWNNHLFFSWKEWHELNVEMHDLITNFNWYD